MTADDWIIEVDFGYGVTIKLAHMFFTFHVSITMTIRCTITVIVIIFPILRTAAMILGTKHCIFAATRDVVLGLMGKEVTVVLRVNLKGIHWLIEHTMLSLHNLT